MGLDGAPGPMTYSIWRGAHFSEEEVASGIAADNADPDNDGLPNIVEYATGADPRTGDAGIFGPQYRLSDLSDFGRTALPDKYLLAIVHRDPRVIDATLTVEYSGDAVTLWTADDAVTVNSAPSLFIVRDRIGLLESPRRLVRLRATVQP